MVTYYIGTAPKHNYVYSIETSNYWDGRPCNSSDAHGRKSGLVPFTAHSGRAYAFLQPSFLCNMIYSSVQSIPSDMTSHVGFFINFLVLRSPLQVQPLARTLTDVEGDAVLPCSYEKTRSTSTRW